MADIAILGIFAADVAFRASRLPIMGETLLGDGFALNPGGKGSNQAVAAARAGGSVAFCSKIGTDTFGDMAMATWSDAGVGFSGIGLRISQPGRRSSFWTARRAITRS